MQELISKRTKDRRCCQKPSDFPWSYLKCVSALLGTRQGEMQNGHHVQAWGRVVVDHVVVVSLGSAGCDRVRVQKIVHVHDVDGHALDEENWKYVVELVDCGRRGN